MFAGQIFSKLCERHIHMAYVSFHPFLTFHIACSEVGIRDKNLLNTKAPGLSFHPPTPSGEEAPAGLGEGSWIQPCPCPLSDFRKVMLFLWALASHLVKMLLGEEAAEKPLQGL